MIDVQCCNLILCYICNVIGYQTILIHSEPRDEYDLGINIVYRHIPWFETKKNEKQDLLFGVGDAVIMS